MEEQMEISGWVPIHRDLLINPDVLALTESQRGIFFSLIIASTWDRKEWKCKICGEKKTLARGMFADPLRSISSTMSIGLSNLHATIKKLTRLKLLTAERKKCHVVYTINLFEDYCCPKTDFGQHLNTDRTIPGQSLDMLQANCPDFVNDPHNLPPPNKERKKERKKYIYLSSKEDCSPSAHANFSSTEKADFSSVPANAIQNTHVIPPVLANTVQNTNAVPRAKTLSLLPEIDSLPSDAVSSADMLRACIIEVNCKHKLANVKWDNSKQRAKWAKEFEAMNRIDGRSWEDIADVIRWSVKDEFWSPNVQSAKKIRQHFDRLYHQMAHLTESRESAIKRILSSGGECSNREEDWNYDIGDQKRPLTKEELESDEIPF